MTGHLFTFTCTHCQHPIEHGGELTAGVADCTGCGAQYRLEVRVTALRGPRLHVPAADAEGAPLIAALMAAARRRAA